MTERVPIGETSDNGGRRILVVANRTCPCAELMDEIERRAATAPLEVLAVAPALNSRPRQGGTDTDEALAGIRERLASAVERLRAAGIEARGGVGDANPLQAIDDSLRSGFDADEIIISTYPPEHSNWLEDNIIERTRERHDLSVTHVVSGYGPEDGAA